MDGGWKRPPQCYNEIKKPSVYRVKVLVSCSDIDSLHEKYGKRVSNKFVDSLEGNPYKSEIFHIHDIGQNIKNAEAALQ